MKWSSKGTQDRRQYHPSLDRLDFLLETGQKIVEMAVKIVDGGIGKIQ